MIEYSIFSGLGERPLNEDYALAERRGDSFCAVLCDGLGGHEGGELASSLVCETVMAFFRRWDGEGDAGEMLGLWIERAQSELMQAQKELGKVEGMKTTVSAIIIHAGKLHTLYVGDSRIYRFRHGFIKGHTPDHSIPQFLAASGEIREKDIRKHPDRNKLLRVMGVEWERPQFQSWDVPEPRSGDAYLLCSDGFWEWIDESSMQWCAITSSSSDAWLKNMLSRVERNGKGNGMDNYTAISVIIR